MKIILFFLNFPSPLGISFFHSYFLGAIFCMVVLSRRKTWRSQIPLQTDAFSLRAMLVGKMC